MKSTDQRLREDEVAEVLRLGRLEDLAVGVAIGAMVLIVLLALLVQVGGPVELVAPIIGILCVVGIVAAGAWAVGSIRTSRALDRAARDTEPKQRPVKLYVLIFTFSISVGIAYWFANRSLRELLWGAWAIAASAAYIWLQRRDRPPGARRSR